MNRMTQGIVVLLGIGVGSLLAGCQSTGDQGLKNVATSFEAGDAIQLPELSHFYHAATAPRYRAVRKPIQEDQARHLRMLAEKAAELAEQTRNWDSDARLMSVAENQRNPRRAAIRDFRESLEGLRTAAEKEDLAAVRSEYSRTIATYQNVVDLSAQQPRP
ncbi:MAG TPA: hypothetical protein PKY77_14820 [Phycisphaerae bacterium]|nr:hypothetical protein [Phycisphaerae bacterium]HRY70581.1 hypothetical protein [Phycisphaerae bacterium]HSA28369.1 hypothetical protein [Phycisphaerae bacterium]